MRLSSKLYIGSLLFQSWTSLFSQNKSLSMFLTQDYKFHLILVRKRNSKQLLGISNAEPEIFIQVLKNSRTFILKREHPTQNQAQ